VRPAEIDDLRQDRQAAWTGRDLFCGRAVGRRLGIMPPAVPCGSDPRRWTAGDIETFAAFLALTEHADGLAKLFNPSGWNSEQHPRWLRGQSDGGRFRPSDDDASDVVSRAMRA
jgi:hypothetical protein